MLYNFLKHIFITNTYLIDRTFLHMKCKHTCVDVLDLQPSLLFFMNREAFVKGVEFGTTSAVTVFSALFCGSRFIRRTCVRCYKTPSMCFEQSAGPPLSWADLIFPGDSRQSQLFKP